MTASTLPELPPAFADSACNLETVPPGGEFIPFETILQQEPMAKGFASLMNRWGPGDHRAAVSLWTQGYFGRFFRPVLAYGLVHDIWFSPRPVDIRVALSDMATPMRFALRRVQPVSLEQLLWSIVHEHAQPVIESVVSLSGTSERLHWSNASFAFHRSYQQVRSLWPQAELPATMATRLRQMERAMVSDHPLFQLTRHSPLTEDGQRLVRKVCCIRYKLDGLKKCGNACPIKRRAGCSGRKDADIHAQY